MKNLTTKFFFIGMMGAGKSYWAEKLAVHFGVAHFDIDAMVEARAGKKIREIFAEDKGEERFRLLEKRALQETAWPELCFIACGGGLPCFFDNMEFMLGCGKVIWLNPPIDLLAERLWGQQAKRPLVAACNNKSELVEKLNSLLKIREPIYRQANTIIPGSPTLAQILDTLKIKS